MPNMDLPAQRVEDNPAALVQPVAGMIAGHQRRRPHGWLRHYAGFLSPGAAAAMPLILERNRPQRLRRLVATVGDSAVQRRRPTRPHMRALTAAPGARLRWRTVPAPASPGPDGAIVHPIAASTCDIDCPLMLGVTQLALPLHLGHECVAEVLSVGERVTTVKPGDRVVVPFQISCGACAPCKAERPGSCISVPPLSSYGMGLATGHFGGAFSDQLAVPYADAMLVTLPEGIDPVAAASVADNICDAYRHIAPHPALDRPRPHCTRRHLHELRRPAPQRPHTLLPDVGPPHHPAHRIPHARALMPHVLELMVQGSLRPEDVVTAVAPLDHAPAALREHVLGGGVKTVLTA